MPEHPATFVNTSDEPFTITWSSRWHGERCVAVRPSPFGTMGPGDTWIVTLSGSNDLNPWVLLPKTQWVKN